MEIADQWRREWAGTAEYGKVVEGGVTRRIARAMEVLHASGPGARMKVMRAAYHTTAGPGVPASSYMVHASRRVYSSGFNSSGYLEPPSIPTEPLEISSTPLALLQDPHADTENYKVTEPDDFEISEPSKWRSSTGGSMRMPSEESSSTDNASIIDVSKNHKGVFRKHSCDSENSDSPLSRRSSGVSPLLDGPALSTLKFKSLLNGNNDWNNRRKSYSFEDASPLSETIIHSNDTLAMESSTDSGICKSTELVNENTNDNSHVRYFGSKERSDHTSDNTFESWLSKNKPNNFYTATKLKNYREHEVIDQDSNENNITQLPTGKVTITLPITLETDQEYETRKNYEEHQRKFKKVEFCKTELHFAAETGKVNIIATDEKPPPSNDFRKRRSAFVPMRDMSEKPITLFGEKTNDFSNESNSLSYTISEFNETDENTAATKSILKNKIPKPKPYLLGENMAFGAHDELKVRRSDDGDDISFSPTAVSLINKQLLAEKRRVGEISAGFSRQHTVSTKTNTFRTTNQSPPEKTTAHKETYEFDREKTQKVVRINDDRNKFSLAKRTPAIIRSPTPARLNTRKLRESDLTYFGVDNALKSIENPRKSQPVELQEDPVLHDLLQSVRLIQQVSNSVCNSESEDAPEYQNIPMNSNYVPKPTPRVRSKYDDKPNHIDEIVLNPIIEQDVSYDDSTTYRRSKSRKQEELSPTKNRSRSEPRKSYESNSFENKQQLDQSTRRPRDHSTIENELRHRKHGTKTSTYRAKAIPDNDNPIYINLKKPCEQSTKDAISRSDVKTSSNSQQRVKNRDLSIIKKPHKLDGSQSNTSQDTDSIVVQKKPQINDQKNNTTFERKKNLSLKRKTDKQQPDKGEKSHISRHKRHSELPNETGTNKSSDSKTSFKQANSIAAEKGHMSRSLHRHAKAAPERKTLDCVTTSKITKDPSDKNSEHEQVKVNKQQSSKDNASNRNSLATIIPKVCKDSTGNKSTYNKEPATKHGSRSSRREYVINYDDKNGTVSSICKIRSGSESPRRKKGAKEIVKEKFKENLKNKSSDKAALLQFEDHQKNSTPADGDRKRKKSKIERTCQVL